MDELLTMHRFASVELKSLYMTRIKGGVAANIIMEALNNICVTISVFHAGKWLSVVHFS